MRSAGARMGAAIAGAAIALLLAGCATAPGGGGGAGPTPEPAQSTLPIDEDAFGAPQAEWLEEGVSFALTTWGSSSCAAEVAEVLLDAADRITLQLAAPSSEACTADMAPSTQEVELPEGAEGRPLLIELRAHDGTVSTGLSLD